MARPRKIRLGDGEITLNGFSPERADEIKSILLTASAGPKAGDLVEIKKDEPIIQVDVTGLTESALGIFQDRKTNEYKLVHVKYNPISLICGVFEVKNCGSFKLGAINNLKMELVYLGLI